jgi:putative redox protein
MKVLCLADGSLEISHRNHKVLADRIPEEGGHDLALEPIELLVGALGSCTGAVLAAYLRRHEKNPEGLKLELDWVADGAPGHRRITDITVKVLMPFALDDRMRATVNRLSSACTVHNTLNSNITVTVLEP